jgi:hypothetical protein
MLAAVYNLVQVASVYRLALTDLVSFNEL